MLQHPAAVWGAQGSAGGEPDVLPVPGGQRGRDRVAGREDARREGDGHRQDAAGGGRPAAETPGGAIATRTGKGRG